MKNKILFLLIIAFASSCGSESSRERKYPIAKMKGDYLCISLDQLFKEIQEILEAKENTPADIDSLFGLSWLEGYVIDEENKDVILFGKKEEQRPSYFLEDLIVNFHNVFGDSIAPFCSLDPQPDNIKAFRRVISQESNDYLQKVNDARAVIGGQKTVVGGVPKNSRHGQIMIYSDYDMKKISQGSLKASNIKSTLDFGDEEVCKKDIGSMSRFWFHIKKDTKRKKYPSYFEADGIVQINECPVVLLTEKQHINEDGELEDDIEGIDCTADLFAENLTEEFENLAKEMDIFAELENLYRLQASLRFLKLNNNFKDSAIDLNFIANLEFQEGKDLPPELPGLVNYKIKNDTTETKTKNGTEQIIQTDFRIVAGGVSQEMEISKRNSTDNRAIRRPARIILKSRPNNQITHWNVIL